mmetsp:Transcript_34674/g.90732  ORF Transcript_34674/g.90732 Transcript_34674/m.90732 type:complete len:80 (+) Transcript_34674:30-269(+)
MQRLVATTTIPFLEAKAPLTPAIVDEPCSAHTSYPVDRSIANTKPDVASVLDGGPPVPVVVLPMSMGVHLATFCSTRTK